MRNLKKFLALVLAMMMVFSLMITANAASVGDLKDVTGAFAEAVEVMNGTGVMVGDGSGDFNPAGTMTRGQAAVIMYHILTGDVDNKQVALFTDFGGFEDVDASDPAHWFAGYVGYCANYGVIEGDGEGHFYPYNEVNGYQMLAMLLRAIGYKDLTVFPGANWEMQVASGAKSLGILNKVDETNYGGNLYKPSSREVVASMTFQAIQLPQYENGSNTHWTATEGGALSVEPNESLGWKWFKLAEMTGVIVGNQATGESKTLIGKVEEITYKKNGTAKTITTSGYDYTGAVLDGTDVTEGNNASANKVIASTLALNLATGLDKFGHMVKVWYKSGTGTAYAAIDKSVASAFIYAGGESGGNVKVDATDSSDGELGDLIDAAGFTIPKTITDLYVSDAFGAMEPTDDGENVGGTKGNSGVYLLISNNNDKVLNVIVALDVSVGKITAKNDYTSPKTVTVDGSVVAKRSVKVADDGNLFLTYGEKSIAVGADVVANAIVGTVTTMKKDNTDKPVSYLGIDKVTKKVSGKVVSLTNSGKVTLNTGDVLEESVLWNVTNNKFKDNKDLLLINANLNFYLDGDGNYLGVDQDLNVPFMAAYGYWEQSGISGVKYYIQGVTQKGVEVREEVSPETYKSITGASPVKIPYLSTENVGNSTSVAVTPAADDQTGYFDTRVVNKELDGGTPTGWDAFTSKTTLTRGDDRFTADGAAKYLTDSTVYHVVTAYGDNLRIQHYTGLNDLLQGADSIQFDGYFFETEDDTEHTAGKNAVVSEALLVNVKRVSPSSFFFNHTAVTTITTGYELKMTVDAKAVQHMMYVAGESKESAVLVSAIDGNAAANCDKSDPKATSDAVTEADKFYLADTNADGYRELAAVDNSTASNKTYAYYSNASGGELSDANTAFGEIKIKKDAADTENVVLKAGDAKVIDVSSTAKTNGIKDYASLRRAVEENNITVAVLVTTPGGNTASVIYVTSCAAR